MHTNDRASIATLRRPASTRASDRPSSSRARRPTSRASTSGAFARKATISGRAGGSQPSGNGEAANYNGWVPYVPNWDVGVVFAWPLFDGTVRAREGASRAHEQVRRDEIAVAKHEEVANIRVRYAA